MNKETFNKRIAKLERGRDKLLAQMEALADKYGFELYGIDHGGDNAYLPEGKKDCDECEGAGKFKKWLGYLQPDGTVSMNYKPGVKSQYGSEEECEECEGTGKVDVEYPGWQNSYC